MNAKQLCLALIQRLPDDCTLEQIAYEVHVAQKIERGLEAVKQGNVFTHEEAGLRLKVRMDRWRKAANDEEESGSDA
jgi:hypothetical protein